MAGAALAGIMLGALFVLAGSLLLPCVAHYVANIVQVGVAYTNRTEPSASMNPPERTE